ncbi:MAG TPA: hypothetical protein VGA56_06900 [Opitutaceae bacterium]
MKHSQPAPACDGDGAKSTAFSIWRDEWPPKFSEEARQHPELWSFEKSGTSSNGEDCE